MPTRCLTFFRAALLTMAVVATGCNGTGSDDAGQSEPPVPIDTSGEARSLEGRSDFPLGLPLYRVIDAAMNPTPGLSPTEIINDFPTPSDTEVEEVENRHVPGQIDTIRTLVYSGVRLEVYEPSSSSDPIITEIRVTRPGLEHRELIDIGSSEAEVHAELGEPVEVRDGYMRYLAVDEGDDVPAAPHYLDIEIVQGQVAEMVWRFYYD